MDAVSAQERHARLCFSCNHDPGGSAQATCNVSFHKAPPISVPSCVIRTACSRSGAAVPQLSEGPLLLTSKPEHWTIHHMCDGGIACLRVSAKSSDKRAGSRFEGWGGWYLSCGNLGIYSSSKPPSDRGSAVLFFQPPRVVRSSCNVRKERLPS